MLYRILAYYRIGRDVHRGVELEVKAGMRIGDRSTLSVALARGQMAALKGGKQLNDGRWPDAALLGRLGRD